DLRNSEDIARLVDTTLNEWGKIDILINNAGILHLKPFLELSLDEFQEMLDVNIRAIFELTQKVIPSMIERKQGTIINIASLAGKNGFKTGTGYSATKYALRGFAASLMMEVREHDIRVVTVFPGSVDTGMIARNPQGAKNKLKPEDVAHAVYSATVVDSRAMMSEIDIRPSNPHK
nr:SDR family NAD(P)-dependent oxidoreductase [Fodinibius sp.]NIV03985.1 SDR family NAD(P)-dependent oxidoreductase [Calditrichia bacterium]NIY27578.1 SDR family NAD(P)-dependent oxidoreductase [Fodinibius sp.]